MFVEVTLTWREVAAAAECGVMRNLLSLKDGRKHADGRGDHSGWNDHVEGACGELAVAKLLDRFWSPSVNAFNAPDIGRHIGVRTRSCHGYDLIVRQRDDPEHLYVLVTGSTPQFRVHGYLLGSQARDDKWVRDHGERGHPAWFVPQAALLPIDDLKNKSNVLLKSHSEAV